MDLKLPNSVISQVDVARILRELNSLNDFFADAKVRQSGTPVQMPKLSRSLDKIAEENGANLLDESHRKGLSDALGVILKSAPCLHISFAVEPSAKALDRVLLWFRNSIHPQTLLTVGLQPSIAAGCVLQTPNQFFDMSLRSYLKDQEPYLAQLINSAAKGNA